MSTNVKARFEITGWDEQPYREAEDGSKSTRATVTRDLSGGLQGSGAVEYLMAYAPDGTAAFVGFELVEGSVDGRSGSVVLQHVGRFEDGLASGDVTVVPGTGTGDLSGLAGRGAFAAEKGPSGTLELELG